VEPAVIAAIIGALGLIAATLVPELLKRGTRYERHRQRVLGIVVLATSTMFVAGILVVVRLIELSEFGWAVGALALCFLGATTIIVGSLGVLAADEPPAETPKAPSSIGESSQREGKEEP
jgi:MFS family permease